MVKRFYTYAGGLYDADTNAYLRPVTHSEELTIERIGRDEAPNGGPYWPTSLVRVAELAGLLLVLFTVACGGEFQGDASEPLAGAAGIAGEATAGAPAGGGGSSSAGAAGASGSSSGGSTAGAGGTVAGSAGVLGAGAGGMPCDTLEVTPPAELSLENWSTELEGQCAAMLEPLTCALTWQSVGWVDDVTYQLQIMSMTCGFPKFQHGSCDAGDMCEPGIHLAVPGNHVRLVLVDGAVDQVLIQGGSDWGAYDIIGVADNDCSPTVPNGWTGQLQAEINRGFRDVLAQSLVECS